MKSSLANQAAGIDRGLALLRVAGYRKCGVSQSQFDHILGEMEAAHRSFCELVPCEDGVREVLVRYRNERGR